MARRPPAGVFPKSVSHRVVRGTGCPAHPEVPQRSAGGSSAAGSFVRGFTSAPGPGPVPPTSPFPGIRSGDLAILSWPVAARGLRIGGGPVHHTQLTNPERPAGDPAPRRVAPHLDDQLSLRALNRVPSSAAVRTNHSRPHPPPQLAPPSRPKLALISRPVPPCRL